MTTRYKTFASQQDAEAFLLVLDKQSGLPSYGVHRGGGIHVPLEVAFNETTSELEAVEGKLYVVAVPDDFEARDGKNVTVDDNKIFTVTFADSKTREVVEAEAKAVPDKKERDILDAETEGVAPR